MMVSFPLKMVSGKSQSFCFHGLPFVWSLIRVQTRRGRRAIPALDLFFKAMSISQSNGNDPLSDLSKRVIDGWCNLHNAGCIIQVAGHVLWPRAAWLYQEAVTHKKANISVSRGLQIVGM